MSGRQGGDQHRDHADHDGEPQEAGAHQSHGQGVVGPRGLDATLALSRDLDTLERLQRDAAALLDKRSLRLLPSATATHPTAS